MSAKVNTPSLKKVLVTGGTGFIGGRLVEKLILDRHVEVRVLVRDFSKAWRLARLPVEMIHGDITDPEPVRKAVEGCDSIVNCAFGTTGTQEAKHAVNVQGTRNILEAALQFGVGRIVHLSTGMVYGSSADGDLDETAKKSLSGNFYADSKLEAEETALDYAKKRELPVVVLQPLVVYGPFCPTWTINVVKTLKAGKVILVNGGEGSCNAVYVDDLANAILLALERKDGQGEAFLISGGEPVTWREFYERYEAMLGYSCTVSMSVAEALAYQVPEGQSLRSIVTESLALLREDSGVRQRILGTREISALRKTARFLIPALVRQSIRSHLVKNSNGNKQPEQSIEEEKPILPLTASMVSIYAAKSRVRIDKAKRLLGYEPIFNFRAGMDLTEKWARWANLLD